MAFTFEGIYDGLLLVSVVISIVLVLVLVSSRLKKAAIIKRQYDEVKDIVGGIVISFKRRQDDQEKKIADLSSQIEGIFPTVQELARQGKTTERRVSSLIGSLRSAFSVNKDIVEHIASMRREIDQLSNTEHAVEKQLSDLDEKYKSISQKGPDIVKNDTPPTVRLTETEEQIVQFLLIEGPKTAPAVEERIGKTREHTARLMKKLWQEGFIERDTQRIPFTYRANERLRAGEETNRNGVRT